MAVECLHLVWPPDLWCGAFRIGVILGVYLGNIGVMENQMESYFGFRVILG